MVVLGRFYLDLEAKRGQAWLVFGWLTFKEIKKKKSCKKASTNHSQKVTLGAADISLSIHALHLFKRVPQMKISDNPAC